MLDSIRPVRRMRRIAFFAVVGLLAAAIAIQWWVVTTPALVWLPDGFVNNFFGSKVNDFAVHRIHRLASGISVDVVLVGLLMQFRRPEGNQASMWQVSAYFTMAIVLNLIIQPTSEQVPPPLWIIFVLGVLAGLLHPSSPLRRIPKLTDMRLLALTAVMAVPMLGYAFHHVSLQIHGLPSDPHWAGSHYQFIAEFAFHLILLGLVSATDFSGRTVTVWLTGISALLMGVAWVMFPDHTSSLGVGWGLLLAVWGIVFIAMGASTSLDRDLVGASSESKGIV